MQKVNVDKTLLIHDINDRVIPISEARSVVAKWNAAELMEISNTGHFKMLRTAEVAETIIKFVQY